MTFPVPDERPIRNLVIGKTETPTQPLLLGEGHTRYRTHLKLGDGSCRIVEIRTEFKVYCHIRSIDCYEKTDPGPEVNCIDGLNQLLPSQSCTLNVEVPDFR